MISDVESDVISDVEYAVIVVLVETGVLGMPVGAFMQSKSLTFVPLTLLFF